MLRNLPNRIRFFSVIFVALVVLIVMIQNGGDTVELLFWTHTPTWLGLFIMGLAGFVGGLLCATYLFRHPPAETTGEEE